MDELRIKLLEFIGWKDLSRESKFGQFVALHGTSPEGKKKQIAPNPTVSLDSMSKVEQFARELFNDKVFRRYRFLIENAYPFSSSMIPAADRAKYFCQAIEYCK